MLSKFRKQIGFTKLNAFFLSTLATCLLFSFPVNGQRAALTDCKQYFGDRMSVSQTLFMHQEGVRHALSVPIEYLEDRWDLVQGSEHQAQLFRVSFPDFEPVTQKQSSEMRQSGNRNYIPFVLHDLVPLEDILATQLSHSVPELAQANEVFRNSPAKFFVAMPDIVSLTYLKPPNGFGAHRDIFTAHEESGQLIAALSCVPIDDAPYPSCRHDFRAHGIDVQVIYPRPLLADWEIIQNLITDFVGCITEE